MKIIVAYDTAEKTCQILMDGQTIENVSGLSLSQCCPEEDEYDLSIIKYTMEGDMRKQEVWSCYANKDKTSDNIKDLFKKS